MICLRSILLALALLLAAAPTFLAASGDARLLRYTETIFLENDGGATVNVRFSAAGAAGDTLLLPFAFSAWPDTVIYDAKIDTLFERIIHGQRRARLTLATAVTTADTLDYAFHLQQVTALGKPPAKDYGNYDLAYRAVNPSPLPINHFSVSIVLPPGMVINGILSSSPARPANAAVSPYTLGKLDSRHCVTLTDSTVLQGDNIALSFQAKSEKKSRLLMVLLVLTAAAYLVAFRDLIKTPPPQE